MRHLRTLLIGILFTILLISIGVIVTINFRPLYYYDINHLQIEETSGYSKEEIRTNYDALIEYCSPFYTGDLQFPTLPSSTEARIHFEEVKVIFVAFYYMAVFCLILLIPIMLCQWKRKDYQYLITSGWTAILLPCLLAIVCFLNFDRTFELFHEIVFRNDYWLFYPETDPIITMLPESFFLHCTILIIGIVIVGSLTLILIGNYLKKRRTR